MAANGVSIALMSTMSTSASRQNASSQSASGSQSFVPAAIANVGADDADAVGAGACANEMHVVSRLVAVSATASAVVGALGVSAVTTGSSDCAGAEFAIATEAASVRADAAASKSSSK